MKEKLNQLKIKAAAKLLNLTETELVHKLRPISRREAIKALQLDVAEVAIARAIRKKGVKNWALATLDLDEQEYDQLKSALPISSDNVEPHLLNA